jgi:phage anti-repressor protein
MKKKLNDMSQDMFNDAMSSTPIPVFTTVNDAAKNDTSDQFTKVPEVPEEQFTKVPEVSLDGNQVKNELIKIDFDKQTVSARALYGFFAPTERFYPWFKRMFSYGLTENIDFTAEKFFLSVNNGAKQDIGDYLLTIDAAKHIAMVQRNEKGKAARTYFIQIEKLYHQQMAAKSQKSEKKETPLLENLKTLVALLEKEQEDYQALQQQHQLLREKKEVLEKESEQKRTLYKHSVDLFTQKVDVALKSLVTGVDAGRSTNEIPVQVPMFIPSAHLENNHPANRLPYIYQMWYNELPTLLSTTDAERIGLKYNISRTTIFRMLRNQQSNLLLFKKLRYGQYEKYYTVLE